MEKRHAIIVIKNLKGQYLQIFQETWNSYLFLNCKIESENDKKSIVKYINDKLGQVPLSIEYKMDKIHTKFSEKDKISKKYHHYFFIIDVNLDITSKEFIVNDNKFKWYSYDELLKDKRIQQVNSDIVELIKYM